MDEGEEQDEDSADEDKADEYEADEDEVDEEYTDEEYSDETTESGSNSGHSKYDKSLCYYFGILLDSVRTLLAQWVLNH